MKEVGPACPCGGRDLFLFLSAPARTEGKVAAMSAVLDFVALSLLPLNWQRDIAALLRAERPPGDVLQRLTSERALDRRAPERLASQAADARDRAAAAGVDIIPWSDPDYPVALAAIVDPPPVLWVRGARAALNRPAVAIVGSRAGSPYALAVAERLAADLAAGGLAVISGLARGVDSAAHRGALAAAGCTVAVLGSGADVVYPREHGALALEIALSGAVASELAPGTPPRPLFFPRRNRIISGLARAVVVVEAGDTSGALITARCALEQGREVLAVPGNVLNGRNRGGHALLRDGAKIVETADDILEELEMPAAGRSRSAPPGDDPVLACLPPGEACDLDRIAGGTGLPPARLLPRLLELELRGLVQRVGGGRFVRI
jgi:DNA processing protein